MATLQPFTAAATAAHHKLDEEGARHGLAALQHPLGAVRGAHGQAGVATQGGSREEAAARALLDTAHQLRGEGGLCYVG
jgi:hypothetical protein